MLEEVQLRYIGIEEIKSIEFKAFMEKCYHTGVYEYKYNRMQWYFTHGDFKVLVAVYAGNYVGISCAYKAIANVHGSIEEIWWGVDAVVLSEMRGRGIGKKLQRKLHEDCPNFSSAWYSPTNGIVKKKCGAKELLNLSFTYYPVSCYFSVLFELGMKKVFNTHFTINKIRIPWFYYYINNFSCKIKDYAIRELSPKEINQSLADYMEENLRNNDFHIVRSADYLRWKYIENPSMSYQIFEVTQNMKRLGIVSFSKQHWGWCVQAKVYCIKIYDIIVSANSSLTQKKLIMILMKYLKAKDINIDGFMLLQPICYYPLLTYPYPSVPMLSTLKCAPIIRSYITYLDQDMEQIFN